MEHIQLITPIQAHILPISRAYSIDKNPRMVRAIAALFILPKVSSFRHFSKISLDSKDLPKRAFPHTGKFCTSDLHSNLSAFNMSNSKCRSNDSFHPCQ